MTTPCPLCGQPTDVLVVRSFGASCERPACLDWSESDERDYQREMRDAAEAIERSDGTLRVWGAR